MTASTAPVAHFYGGWQKYQELLVNAIAPLSPEAIGLAAAPNLRTVGALATHIIGVRAGWIHYTLLETDPRLEEFANWSRTDPQRPADELVRGLETTWAIMAETILRYSPERMAETVEDTDDDGNVWQLSRGWVIWHLMEHDLHHGGEISYSLGMH
ncbi:MAG: DinB family protein, partial [Caldilineaceae bacterium]